MYSSAMSLIEHKKVRLDYEILEEFEAGLELFGHEVKSIRGKHGKLEGAHVIVRGGEAYVVGMQVPPFQAANTHKEYDPERTRKLLLTKKEIRLIGEAESQKGLTVVPISVYNKGRNLKVKIGIARGKKKFDKRADLKKRDVERDIRRTLKNQ